MRSRTQPIPCRQDNREPPASQPTGERPVPTRSCPPPDRVAAKGAPLTVRDHFQWQLFWLYYDVKRAPIATVEQELQKLRAMQRRILTAMGYRV